MWHMLKTACMLFVLLTLLTGIAYPLAVTAIASVAFSHKATGSLIRDGGRVVGSELLGQSFDSPRYFWGRPSSTSPVPYNGLGGSGSNQATTNPALVDAVKERIARLRAADPGNTVPVPVDLVTASASGLDPHISAAAAHYQAARVARARGIPVEQVEAAIVAQTAGPTLGLLGQSRVHVLLLNRDLDARQKSH